MERMFREEGTYSGHVTDRRKVAAGSRGQVAEQFLKARLPAPFTELIPLDKEGKGAAEGSRLTVSTELVNTV